MTEFTKHDENTAPEGSKALLAKSKAAFGRIPGLHATMAEAPLPNARLEALRDFTLLIVRDRGHVDDAAVKAFLDASFTKRNILEVVLGYAQKIMSNYTNHLAKTPVDAAFEIFSWSKAS